MNKARRQELKKLKYKKRLIKRGFWNNETRSTPKGISKDGARFNFTAYLNSSAPCSCPVCSHSKYKRAKVKKSENGMCAIKLNVGMQEMVL